MEEEVKAEEIKTPAEEQPVKTSEKSGGSKIPVIIAAVVLVLAGLVWLFIKLSPETTGKIRDISVILFVIESVVSLTALVVLAVQIARLANFLKYELNPILKNTGKTVKKFSGTVSFLCDNAVEPTMKTASTISGIRSAASGVLSLFKK